MKKCLQSLFLCFSILSLVDLSVATAEAPFCDALLALSRHETPTLFSVPVKYIKSARSGQEMAYQIIHPTNGKKEYFIMEPGLGNAMDSMQPLAKKFIADGYGIVIVDLHGHGRTLGRMLQTMEANNSKSFPDTFKHQDNVLDIRDLIIHENIRYFRIIGHSHGGGVGYALASEFDRLQKAGKLNYETAPEVRSAHLINPYVSRIDKFLTDLAGNPELWVQETSKNLVKAGMDAKHVDAVLDPIFEFFFNAMKTSQYFMDLIKNGFGGQFMIDKLMDPTLEATLHKKFSEYFTARLQAITKKPLNVDEKQFVELQVTISLKIVKSNRDFDLLDRTRDIPQVSVPIQIIGSRGDTLVPTAQLKELYLRLKQSGFQTELRFLSDIRAGHDMEELNINEIYALIMKEINREEKNREQSH